MSPSAFGWYAVDPAQRRRMMEAVDQFRDRTTVDDLGIGGIRDSFSDALFPGTSTLHTRLRYALFVPWLMQAAAHGGTARDMQRMFRNLEYGFIDVLQRGGEAKGVFGRQSGRTLTRLPSVVYWGAIISWGLVERGLQVHTVFERSVLRREEARRQPLTEDIESRFSLVASGFDPDLPDSPDLRSSASFDLRREDATYLKEKITLNRPDSLLAHLANHRPATWSNSASAPQTAWDPVILEQLPGRLSGILARAEKFSFSMLGASLLYNLLVAEEAAGGSSADDGTVEQYRDQLAAWNEEARYVPPLSESERFGIWEMVSGMNRRLNVSTRDFLSKWCDSAHLVRDVAEEPELRDLIRGRERQVKGSLGRLGNRRALDSWGGASGAGRLEFRWRYARSHIQDIYDGLEAA